MPVLGGLGFEGSTFSDADFGLSGILLGALNQMGGVTAIVIGIFVILAGLVGLSIVGKSVAKEE